MRTRIAKLCSRIEKEEGKRKQKKVMRKRKKKQEKKDERETVERKRIEMEVLTV